MVAETQKCPQSPLAWQALRCPICDIGLLTPGWSRFLSAGRVLWQELLRAISSPSPELLLGRRVLPCPSITEGLQALTLHEEGELPTWASLLPPPWES